MLHLVYVGEKDKKYVVDFGSVNENVIQIIGDFPVKGNGFTLSRIDYDDGWDYTDYRTVYKYVDGGAQFSNDGSIYVAPQEPEIMPEPEPYVPTLEETKAAKLQEISMACEQIIYAGVDVALPSGTEHFSLTYKDQLNLLVKRDQVKDGCEKIEYHQDVGPCKYYSAEEIGQIINTAFEFVTYHTTYCNALKMWIRSAGSVEEVDIISYGCDIPEEYQNEVIKDKLVKAKEG